MSSYAAFSLYVARESGLHRLHPLTKLALTGFCLFASLVLPGVWATYAAFGVILLPLAAWGQVLPLLLRAAWRTVLPFALSLFLIQGFFWTGGTPVLALGPLSLKREGVLFAIQSTGRILLIVSSFLLLSLSTRPDALMIALSQRGVPTGIAYIILATIQIVPRFQAKAATILDAQRSRGLETEGHLRQRLRALLPLIKPLVLGSIVDIEERAIALEARAFSRRGPKTSLLVLVDSPAQAAVRWLLLLAALALLAARLFRAI
jgi:energy-coupling factor transport system permease protein